MVKDLIEKIKGFTPKKIFVTGDLILDEYTIGECKRVNPEAPVLVVDVAQKKQNPGGAGNTAVNIKKLGSIPYLTGILGQDALAETFIKELKKREINYLGIFLSPYCKTVFKERIVASNQQLLRIDYHDKIPDLKEHSDFIYSEFNENLSHSNIFIISDYAKGTLSEDLIKNIINACREKEKTIIIDPRPEHTDAYKNASLITPNFKEACVMSRLDIAFSIENAEKLAKTLYEKLNSGIILTLSELGMLYYNGDLCKHFPTFKREVRDVAGAGDTVVAALAVGLANNLSTEEAVIFANHAGGVKVQKAGVQPVSLDEIVEDIKFHNNL